MPTCPLPLPESTPRRVSIGDSALAGRLRRELEGEVIFDAFSRGRYSTDASIYQIEPIGVVVPRHQQDIVCAIQIAADAGIPVLPRGGGTSQIGQTVGKALVIDSSKYLNQVTEFDPASRSVCVEPGVVLDQLNRYLKPQGLFYPSMSLPGTVRLSGVWRVTTAAAHVPSVTAIWCTMFRPSMPSWQMAVAHTSPIWPTPLKRVPAPN